jgi:hypothetical protein
MLAVLLPGGAGELWFRPLGLVCWGCVFPLLVCVGYGYVGLWASALCGGATYRRRPPGVIDGGASGQLTPFSRRRGLSPSFTLLLSVGRNIMVMERGKGHSLECFLVIEYSQDSDSHAHPVDSRACGLEWLLLLVQLVDSPKRKEAAQESPRSQKGGQ